MKKLKRKIISGGIILSGIICLLGISSLIEGSGGKDSISVSAPLEKEMPIIILDAGHGEST